MFEIHNMAHARHIVQINANCVPSINKINNITMKNCNDCVLKTWLALHTTYECLSVYVIKFELRLYFVDTIECMCFCSHLGVVYAWPLVLGCSPSSSAASSSSLKFFHVLGNVIQQIPRLDKPRSARFRNTTSRKNINAPCKTLT